jgi:predicted PurR-regulated permease PerM
MFLALLDYAITLLTALLGKMKKIKRIRFYVGVMLIVCATVLVFVFIKEKPYTSENNSSQPVIYNVNNYNYTISRPLEDIHEAVNEIVKIIKELHSTVNDEEMIRLEITDNSLKFDFYSRK